MKSKNICISIIFLTIFNKSLFCQGYLGGGVIYGENWSFFVSAPNGWIMDSDSMSKQGIYGLFYEEGKLFGSQYGTPIIYIVPFRLNIPTDEELVKFAQSDITGYVSKGAKAMEINKTYANEKRLYITFDIDLTNGRYETCVFTRNNDCGLIIILNANNIEQRRDLFQKLSDVVNSIKFMDIIHK